MYGEKIKIIRELRGFSQEYVAIQLGIAQNSFSKIETGQTRLSADTLKKIADLLGVSPIDILSKEPTVINFESKQHKNENSPLKNDSFYPRDFVEKIIESKDSEIQNLKEIICGLIKEKESILQFLKK